jgi:hypothetical protein
MKTRRNAIAAHAAKANNPPKNVQRKATDAPAATATKNAAMR